MYRLTAVVTRLLKGLWRDKRTVFFVLFAPLLVLTLIYFIINTTVTANIGVVDLPYALSEALGEQAKEKGAKLYPLKASQIEEVLKNNQDDIAIILEAKGEKILAYIDSSSPSYQKSLVFLNEGLGQYFEANLKNALEAHQVTLERLIKNKIHSNGILSVSLNLPKRPSLELNYLYGEKDGGLFDHFGAGIIGVFVFLFVYLLGGISFLGERISGTMAKMLSTPIRKEEILLGYIVAFGFIGLIQTALLSFYVTYGLKMAMLGSPYLVILINCLTAFVALSLGFLVSSLSKSEFQLIQTVPIIIVPQVFLCGLFYTEGFWERLSFLTPLRYTVSALKAVILKGARLSDISSELLALVAFFFLFISINLVALRKERKF